MTNRVDASGRQASVCVCVCTCVRVCVDTYVRMCVCVYVCDDNDCYIVPVRACIHMYTHVRV